MTHSFNLIN